MKKPEKPLLKVILADKLYVPSKAFLALQKTVRKSLIKEFQQVIYDPSLCIVRQTGRECSRITKHLEDNPESPPTIPCKSCGYARRKLSCVHKKTIRKKKYIAFYLGDKDSIKLVIKELKKNYILNISDKRTLCPLSDKLQFKVRWKKLEEPRKSEQKRVSKKWLKYKTGACTLPPRSGKTILSAIIAASLGQKTMVVAHQKELLEQFQKDWIFATSLKKKYIKINPTIKEVDKLSVALFTIQQFTSKNGKIKIKALKDKFGLIVIDEVHKAASDAYSKAINKFRAKYRLGVTATYLRRDQKHFRVRHTVGLPKVEGGSEMLSCNYRVCNTNWTMPTYENMNGRTWNFLWTKLSKNKQRNKFITALIMKDLEKGHKVIVPLRYVKHITELGSMVRNAIRKANLRNISVKEYSSSLIKGADYREQVSQEIREGKHNVVIAITSMISLGFDAPPMSCIYMNAGGYIFDRNNMYQQYSRVRTPYKGKNKPLIRILQDKGIISEKSTKVIELELNSRKFNKLKTIGIKKGKRGWAE